VQKHFQRNIKEHLDFFNTLEIAYQGMFLNWLETTWEIDQGSKILQTGFHKSQMWATCQKHWEHDSKFDSGKRMQQSQAWLRWSSYKD